MGLIIAKNSLIAKSQSLIDKGNESQQDLDNLLNSLNSVVNDEILVGTSYSSAKNYITNIHILSIKAIMVALEHEINANQLVIEQCATYLSDIDYIDEDIIQNTITRNEQTISYFEGMANSSALLHLQYLQAIADSYRHQNMQLQKQIERAYDFHHATCNLHSDVSIEIETIENNIMAAFASVNIVGTDFTFSADLMNWSTEYVEQWEVIPLIQQKELFKQNLQTQFGFDERTATIMWDVYLKIQGKYQDLTQQERDHLFTRAFSQFVYSGSKWNAGSGEAYTDVQSEDEKEDAYSYFINILSVSSDDFYYAWYMVRLQSQIDGGDAETLISLRDNLDTLNIYYTNYLNAMGIEYKEVDGKIDCEELTMDMFLDQYSVLYNNMQGKTDFAHFMYTIAGNVVADDANTVKVTYAGLWNTHDGRRAYIGWLGDATWAGVLDNFLGGGQISFGNGDYMADLDADNIVFRMRNNNLSFVDATNTYYADFMQDATVRTVEFKHNHGGYEAIENQVIEKSHSTSTIKKLSTNYPEAYDFLMSVKNDNSVMIDYTP
ncbi:MAG: hypothetical protein R3Y67_09990 [Eubacteriales bacterium]